MKKAFLILFTFTIISCGSENLSNSKAEDIISDCLEKTPQQRQELLTLGKATFSTKDYDVKLLNNYLQLKEEGYIEMELIKEITKGYRRL